jgi:hypothetical protein
VDTLVLVDVLAFTPSGVVVAFAPVLDEAFGVLTPVFTDVSEVGLARRCFFLIDEEPFTLVSDTGEAVLAFTPAPFGEAVIPVSAAPVVDVAGVVT